MEERGESASGSRSIFVGRLSAIGAHGDDRERFGSQGKEIEREEAKKRKKKKRGSRQCVNKRSAREREKKSRLLLRNKSFPTSERRRRTCQQLPLAPLFFSFIFYDASPPRSKILE